MAFFSNVVAKLKQGLARTRETLVSGLRMLMRGRILDDQLIGEVEALLLKGDLGVPTTSMLIGRLRDDIRAGELRRAEEVPDRLRVHLKQILQPAAGATEAASMPAARPLVILVTGINGAGKTTSIAKLGARYRREGKSVVVAACDTFRAGAVRQLEIWAERLGLELVRGMQGGDPAAVAFDACTAARSRGADVLILDTAGRLHTQEPLMRQLAKIRSVVARQIPGAPHETFLVLDATTGQNALRQVEEFSKAAPLTGLLLAKLDGTARGGIVVALRAGSGVPVRYVGTGESPEDLEPFDPDAFVEALFSE